MQGSVPSAWRSSHRGTPSRACPASAYTTRGALTNGLKWTDHVQSIHLINAFFAQVPLHEHALPLIFPGDFTGPLWSWVNLPFSTPSNENVVPQCAKSHVLKQSSGIFLWVGHIPLCGHVTKGGPIMRREGCDAECPSSFSIYQCLCLYWDTWMWPGNGHTVQRLSHLEKYKKNRTQSRGRNISSKTVAKMVPIDCEYSQSSVLFNHEQNCGLYRKKKPVANHKRLSTWAWEAQTI